MRAIAMVALVAVGCGSDRTEPDPVECACAADALPSGFYRITQTPPGGQPRSTVEQLVRTGAELQIGFAYAAGDPNAASAVNGEMTECQLDARQRIDIALETYAGVWSCTDSRITGTVHLNVIDQTSELVIEPVEPPFAIDAADYRLYGSESVDLGDAGYSVSSPDRYVPASFGRLVESDWVLLGQAADSASFALDAGYPVLMLTWPVDRQFAFDALVDDVAGVPLEPSLGDNASFIAHATADPEALAGQPDGAAFSGVTGFAGFLAITFPRRGEAPALDAASGEGMVRIELAP